MAEMLVDSTKLDACLDAEADAIRAKTGGTDPIPYDYANNKGFADAIAAIPSGTTITDGIVVKARNANGYATEIDVYGNLMDAQFSYAAEGQPYNTAWRNLTIAHLKSNQTNLPAYAFKGTPLTVLDGIDMIESASSWALARTPLTIAVMPELRTIGVSNLFSYCQQLRTVKCPKASGYLTNGSNRLFWNCTALETVEIGGIGYGNKAYNSQGAFTGCSQSGLTVTVYATGDNADGLVTAIRSGATNATIIIKASEATTYNGTSYAAGDTILTSEVT